MTKATNLVIPVNSCRHSQYCSVTTSPDPDSPNVLVLLNWADPVKCPVCDCCIPANVQKSLSFKVYLPLVKLMCVCYRVLLEHGCLTICREESGSRGVLFLRYLWKQDSQWCACIYAADSPRYRSPCHRHYFYWEPSGTLKKEPSVARLDLSSNLRLQEPFELPMSLPPSLGAQRK